MGLSSNTGAGTAGVPSAVKFAADRLAFSPVWVQSPLTRNALIVYWTPRVGSVSQNPVGYNVYRSVVPRWDNGQPIGEKLNTTLVTVPLFADNNVDLTRKTFHWYTVTEVLQDGAERQLSRPVNTESYTTDKGTRFKNISPQRIYKEWIRRKQIILNNTAELCDLLIERTAGKRCSCFSGEFESASTSCCPSCYGTGFDRGFELMRDIQVRVIPRRESLELQPRGLVLNNNPQGWCLDFPLLRTGDVVARKNGLRYTVENLDVIRHQGLPTEQTFDLHVLDTTEPVYRYIIPTSDNPEE